MVEFLQVVFVLCFVVGLIVGLINSAKYGEEILNESENGSEDENPLIFIDE